jgi:hypothetical protein
MTTPTIKQEGARHTGGLPTPTPRTARLIAWCAFTLGVAASIAANVAHARPELGPRLASAFAPVALLLTVEIMSRVPWPAGSWWKLGRWVGTGTVALVAAVTSYRHMSALLAAYGEDQLTAIIQPACVDGLMVVASLALLALGHTTTETTIEHTHPIIGNVDEHERDSASRNTSWETSTQRHHTPAVEPAPAGKAAQVPDSLAMSAQMVAFSHQSATGKPITLDTLAEKLGVNHTTARQLLTHLGHDIPAPATPPERVNGSPIPAGGGK